MADERSGPNGCVFFGGTVVILIALTQWASPGTMWPFSSELPSSMPTEAATGYNEFAVLRHGKAALRASLPNEQKALIKEEYVSQRLEAERWTVCGEVNADHQSFHRFIAKPLVEGGVWIEGKAPAAKFSEDWARYC